MPATLSHATLHGMLKEIWRRFFPQARPRSIWVFYRGGFDREKDEFIREALGRSAWFGSGISSGGERDHSFHWSPETEARARQLLEEGVISRTAHRAWPRPPA